MSWLRSTTRRTRARRLDKVEFCSADLLPTDELSSNPRKPHQVAGGFVVSGGIALLVASDLDNTVTATEAAQHIGVSVKTVVSWVDRGYLQPCDARGKRKLYRLIDVVRVARDTRHRAIGNRIA